jgi:hypothetical protein
VSRREPSEECQGERESGGHQAIRLAVDDDNRCGLLVLPEFPASAVVAELKCRHVRRGEAQGVRVRRPQAQSARHVRQDPTC